ncbi:MAG: hypothetical protein JW776_01285 [Candidatus Lokiarchaeota archaeon]|nr:hypothetical protein [Candidatus Lokiarchaeota archaeon]
MINEIVLLGLVAGLSITTFVLFFATDFGGWYIYRPYDYDIYRYQHMFSEMVWWSFLWMLPLAGLFVTTSF